MKPISMPSAVAPGSASSASDPVIRAGDRVLAFEVATGERHLLLLDGTGTRKHKGLGILDPDRWVGRPWGARLRVGDKDLVLLRPTLPDLTATLARKAAMILSKD